MFAEQSGRTDLMLCAVAYLRRGAWGELIDNPGLDVGFFAYGSSDTPDDDDGGDEADPARLGRAG
jgi:hypothetical protein